MAPAAEMVAMAAGRGATVMESARGVVGGLRPVLSPCTSSAMTPFLRGASPLKSCCRRANRRRERGAVFSQPSCKLSSEAEAHYEREFQLHSVDGRLTVRVEQGNSGERRLVLQSDTPRRLLLHWGFRDGPMDQWQAPQEPLCPGNTTVLTNAAQTPLVREEDGKASLRIDIQPGMAVPNELVFVLHDPESGMWISDPSGQDFQIPILAPVVVEKNEVNGNDGRATGEASSSSIAEEAQQQGAGSGLANFMSNMAVDLGLKKRSGGRDMPFVSDAPAASPENAEEAPVPPPEDKSRVQRWARDPRWWALDEEDGSSALNMPPLWKFAAAISDSVADARFVKVSKPVREVEILSVSLEDRKGQGGASKIYLLAAVSSEIKDLGLLLHAGVVAEGDETWTSPPPNFLPPGTPRAGVACDVKFTPVDRLPSWAPACTELDALLQSCQEPAPIAREGDSEGVPIKDNRRFLVEAFLEIPAEDFQFKSLNFVLTTYDKSMWWKDGNQDFAVPLPGRQPAEEEGKEWRVPHDFMNPVSRGIIEGERSSMWTLMHRYNLCCYLLDTAGGGGPLPVELLAQVLVWLRYSSMQHLTWQRNYNTQPRILSEAQGRLTMRIAQLHAEQPQAREYARQMLSVLGRGGQGSDGQRIRDEILHIMQRHHIPEARETFIEQWHQKLHNNTTPDDVAICTAYIRYQETWGDGGEFWRVLGSMGVTREKMASYERAITCEPYYWPEKRDGLIHDCYNYLHILKAVHSGADLSVCKGRCWEWISDHERHLLHRLECNDNGHMNAQTRAELAVETRASIRHFLDNSGYGDMYKLREFLYLDAALEDQVRRAVESAGGDAEISPFWTLAPAVESLCMSVKDNVEMCMAMRAWQALPGEVHAGNVEAINKTAALQTLAAVDRIQRAISRYSDIQSERMQPFAEYLGKECDVPKWAIELFSEEVVRGSAAFPVSLVLGRITPLLREIAGLGDWLVISPGLGTALGWIESVPDLHAIQTKTYSRPTILIAKRVGGEEDIPSGVVAVITPDSPDVLSHCAVRARNLGVMLLTGNSEDKMQQLKSNSLIPVKLNLTPKGDLEVETVTAEQALSAALNAIRRAFNLNGSVNLKAPSWCQKWALTMDEFVDGKVGGKSRNLADLRSQLPGWIRLPASIAIPFGSFDAALADGSNAEFARRFRELESRASTRIGSLPDLAVLAEIRGSIRKELKPPPGLRESLRQALKEQCGEIDGLDLVNDKHWQKSWDAIRRVWASKFNDRAQLSGQKANIDMSQLTMAVLVQQIVPPRYAFVLHTRNPQNNDPNEIYGELVLGMGEVLVGNFPGRALSFVCRKTPSGPGEPTIVAFPSKSTALIAQPSLIFRSDSNGEDLESYAGAGLYDSVPMLPLKKKPADMSCDPLILDENFRRRLLRHIAQVGMTIENALGSAQDVEGVFCDDGTVTVVQTRPQV